MQNKTEKDPHSYAEPEKVRISHLDMELTPDFNQKKISGIVELTLDWLDTASDTLILDTKKLDIQQIEVLNQDGNWSKTTFNLGQEDKILGSALRIAASSNNTKVKISYQTSPEAEGLQWLDPEQTATKKFPYLYSHSQPINARSWIPLQDTPAVRQTYNARINTPKALRAVMSAGNDPEKGLDAVFEFNMVQTIPSYLIAFAVGNIAARRIGPRSVVYSEPGVVEKAASEFEETENIILTIEGLYGKYVWDTYDMLVMPPSFPMGGMENPRMTFVTPTVLAGDKSLVSVNIHELAHSWSGNLVTNGRWEDIWLNEGFTTYVQNRGVEANYGEERANQEFLVSINNLHKELESLSEPDQHLVPNLDGRDPHEGFGNVAYIKGAWFLKTLEKKFGRTTFDEFLKEYFSTFAFKSITTPVFEAFLKTHLIDKYPGKYSMEEVNRWIHQPGIPEDAVKVESERFKLNDTTRPQWLRGEISTAALEARKWSSDEWQYFLNKLPGDLTQTQLQELDDCYQLTGMGNEVVAAQWYKVAIDCKFEAAKPEIGSYLCRIGRRYLVAPLYEKLLKTEAGKLFAQEIYKEARAGYHSVTREAIDGKFKAAGLEVPLREEASLPGEGSTALNRYRFNAVKPVASNGDATNTLEAESDIPIDSAFI